MENQKISRMLFAAAIFLLLISSSAFGQAGAAARKTAEAGDTVWVVINHVKPDKRAQYERFVNEIFWPASRKLDSKSQRLFDQTRVLNAVGPEQDGTYTYVFLMDPVVSGGNYEIESALKKMYPGDKAAEYFKLFEETLAREGELYMLTESKYWGTASKK